MKLQNQILFAVFFLCTGCAALVVGGAAALGTYTYTAGQMKRTYNANLDKSYAAAISGCESLQLPIFKKEKKLSSASITTQDAERDVWISLKAITSSTTEITVRVGYLGDEFASKRIHEAIHKHF